MFNYITVTVLIAVAGILTIGCCIMTKSVKEVNTIERRLERIEKDIDDLSKTIKDESQELFKRIVAENEIDKILND